jgi:hypothetical protein
MPAADAPRLEIVIGIVLAYLAMGEPELSASSCLAVCPA